MSNYEKGKTIKGTVTGITDYGIFVSVDNLYTGLIHISEISNNYVSDIHNYVKEGTTIYAKILDIDPKTSHLKLSIKGMGRKKQKIVETPTGFKTLKEKLPIWVEENLKKIKNI